MTMLTQVPLQSDLAESLQQVVGEQGLTVENVLDELVRQYLQQARRDKVQQESEQFERLHPEIKERYYHQHVAMYNGQLVDHDENLDELLKRVRTKFGRAPVLIAFVEDVPIPTFTVRRPQLVHAR
jgi:hypothetical protein